MWNVGPMVVLTRLVRGIHVLATLGGVDGAATHLTGDLWCVQLNEISNPSGVLLTLLSGSFLLPCV